MKRGLILAIVQTTLLLSVIAKYQWDRAFYPAAWAEAVPVDPGLPVRGRYISLKLFVDYRQASTTESLVRCHLVEMGGRVVAYRDDEGDIFITRVQNRWSLVRSVAYFIPEHASDVSRQANGSLFVKVTIPPKGDPRPIYLAEKRGTQMIPLN
jgi:uncharacterized membrane-anchored protein